MDIRDRFDIFALDHTLVKVDFTGVAGVAIYAFYIGMDRAVLQGPDFDA